MSDDLIAAYAHVESVVPKADYTVGHAPAWHGWALREAFVAGCNHARADRIEGLEGAER